mmetsp:Transcript_25857/g.74518  ORF Transcript_25857/g.74518 Transcript_25857/m.74518 type:complete len:325 (-) Transcript_25857:95-1069(-)
MMAPALDDVLAASFAQHSILACVRLRELSRLEAAGRCLRHTAAAEAAWLNCALGEARPGLVVPPPPSGVAVGRDVLRQLVTALRRCLVAEPEVAPLRLQNFAHAQRLAAAIGHVSAHGGDAGAARIVSVAMFRFDPPPAENPLLGGMGPSPLTSRCVTVALPDASGFSEAWELRLNWRPTAGVLVCARRRRGACHEKAAESGKQEQPPGAVEQLSSQQRQAESGLSVDIVSVSDVLTMRLLDVRLPVDGGWAKSEGFCSATGSRANVANELAGGLLAVVGLRREHAPEGDIASFRRAHTTMGITGAGPRAHDLPLRAPSPIEIA